MFEGLDLTDKGIEMLVRHLNGHGLEFTCIKMGDGEQPEDQGRGLTDLVSTKQRLAIARSKVQDDNTMLLGGNLYGRDVEEGFYWKEIGIFARLTTGEDQEEYMLAYNNCGDTASYIPSGGAVTEQLIDVILAVGDLDNITIEVSESLLFVTQDYLDESLNTFKNTITTQLSETSKNLTEALNKHINNKNNPHTVTKTQVGLSNVQNYAVATEAEAKSGTTDAKYMTPLKVKQAVQAYGVTSDGNTIIKVGGNRPSPQSGKTIIWIDTNS